MQNASHSYISENALTLLSRVRCFFREPVAFVICVMGGAKGCYAAY
jgi:hypothetical protein